MIAFEGAYRDIERITLMRFSVCGVDRAVRIVKTKIAARLLNTTT
jgi:hypothetical protein